MKGIFSALLVPFDEEGKVEEKGLREIVRQNIDVQKVDGLYVNGSSEKISCCRWNKRNLSLKP